ncbi:MAG: hypothetical protein KC503_12065 [Myxococcales bacterium]|nr:hypothetical protein [Myxococcales bacterium]
MIHKRNWLGTIVAAAAAVLLLGACATTGARDAADDDDDRDRTRRVPHALAALESIAQANPRPWHTARARNFKIAYHAHRELAERVVRRAAALWQTTHARWQGRAAAASDLSCEVTLYNSYRELVVMTGGSPKLGEAHVRHSRLMRGRILTCRINLTADDHHLLDATLPHEITHIVLGQLVGRRVPLWANEGAATRAERAARRHAHRRALVRRALASGRAYALADLFRIHIYPASAWQRRVFYAQSFTVVDLLLRLGGHARFLRLLRAAHDSGWSRALSSVYGLTSLQQLEQALRADLAR